MMLKYELTIKAFMPCTMKKMKEPWGGKAEMKSERNVLKVKMFGVFSAEYEGKNVVETAAGDAQFIYLLQILWYNGENGISRRSMLENLFEEREPEDPAHALRCTIYRAKGYLNKQGMPDCKYILKKNGSYYWNEEIPLETDVQLFDRYAADADAETDEGKKCGLLAEACFLYRGELLADYASCLWVSHEARIYREKFRKCVEKAAALFRKRKEYQRLRELGRHAAKADPGMNWEVLEMEALYMLGKTKEAAGLYAATVSFYLNECGTMPSNQLREYLIRMDDGKEYMFRMLDVIQENLEEKGAEGGYLCSPSVFQGIYQIIQRMSVRGGGLPA